MKKVYSIFLMFLLFFLCACGVKNINESTKDNKKIESQNILKYFNQIEYEHSYTIYDRDYSHDIDFDYFKKRIKGLLKCEDSEFTIVEKDKDKLIYTITYLKKYSRDFKIVPKVFYQVNFNLSAFKIIGDKIQDRNYYLKDEEIKLEVIDPSITGIKLIKYKNKNESEILEEVNLTKDSENIIKIKLSQKSFLTFKDDKKEYMEKINLVKFQTIYIKHKDNERQVTVLDVRTKEEYDQGHLRLAKNLSYTTDDDFRPNLNKLNNQKTILIYCKSSNRASKAADFLFKNGFKKIFILETGYEDFANNNPLYVEKTLKK